MKPVWATRTGAGMAPSMQAYSQSVQEDAPFVPYDVQGSIAHVKGLQHAGLLDAGEAAALIAGLQDLAQAHAAGAWVLDAALEDVHMNIEAWLTQHLGDVAKKLHTGRSRNDQVATCITLYVREHLVLLAEAAEALAIALAGQAEAHIATPWAAKTHGQPAQPATLGFLLHAHAHRMQCVSQQALAALAFVQESPLGSGAVAGSTLPLDPAFTADLLGLDAPQSALLATGARDPVEVFCHVAAVAGLACASLSQDLIDLYTTGALQLPAGYTTGSSLMPHKRNPDVLELARGTGKALTTPWQEVVAVTAGMGLGYQRDLQLTKPPLVKAAGAINTLAILHEAVTGSQFDPAVLAKTFQAPGLTATDAAEALVQNGMSFRDAYSHMAAYHAALEAGASPPEALASLGLPGALQDAVLAALSPDPARRATQGGPAPQAVQNALEAFHATAAALAAHIDAAWTPIHKAAALVSA